MSEMKTMYQVTANLEGFGPVGGMDTREEAEQHISDVMQWIEENNLIEYSNLSQEISTYQREVNPKRDKNATWVRLMHHYVGY